MIEITNRMKHPVQIIIRSKKDPHAFNTLNIPGVGSGKNIFLLEDERHTDYIDRVEQWNLISTKKINKSHKGE